MMRVEQNLPVLAAALAYAAKGYPVFPCRPDNKRPLTNHSFEDATTDPEQINAWWQKWPGAMIGIPTGPQTFSVVDVDVCKETGEAIGEANAERLGLTDLLVPGLQVRTPSGGRHAYFFGDLPTNANKIAPKIDTRGAGGYVIVPPSVSCDPRFPGTYSWEGPGLLDAEPPMLPERIRDVAWRARDRLKERPQSSFKIDTGCAHARDSEAGVAEIGEALSYIDPDLSYDDWVAVLMALHAHLGDAGFSLADEWSRRGTKYQPGDVETRWRGFAPDGGVSIATVFALARRGGCDLAELTRKHRQRQTSTGGGSVRSWIDDFNAGAFGGSGGEGDHYGAGAQDSAGRGDNGSTGGGGAQKAAGPPMPTPWEWRDPESIPPRPWVYGRHLIRKQVSITVAPGGVGKSSLTIVEALAMVTGRSLLEDKPWGRHAVWLFNLEDPRDEMDRRILGAMAHYGIWPDEIGGRLFVDTGRERTLCTAVQSKDGVRIMQPEMEALAQQITARNIDVLVVDPFVSSHQAAENDNGAIDAVAKEWARLADRCNCAIELVHHVRKANGVEQTSEAARGASALLAAARSARVLNRISGQDRERWNEWQDGTIFSVDRDKANLAPPGERAWRHMASVTLANGDHVGVCEVWTPPDDFDGVSVGDLLKVQRAIEAAAAPPRFSDQTEAWVGHIVAATLGLDATEARKRIKRMINEWIKNGALRKVQVPDEKRMPRPCVEVGEWAHE